MCRWRLTKKFSSHLLLIIIIMPPASFSAPTAKYNRKITYASRNFSIRWYSVCRVRRWWAKSNRSIGDMRAQCSSGVWAVLRLKAGWIKYLRTSYGFVVVAGFFLRFGLAVVLFAWLPESLHTVFGRPEETKVEDERKKKEEQRRMRGLVWEKVFHHHAPSSNRLINWVMI